MKLSLKTRILDLFRRIFKIRRVEAYLVQLTKGRPSNHVVAKLVPAHYLYPTPSIRDHSRDGLRLELDLSDYIDHGLYFGIMGAEEESYRILSQLIEPHFNCIDVGTKNGYISLRLANLAPEGRTLGFEADPVNFRQSVENQNLNSPRNLVIHNIGLGDRRAEAHIDKRVARNRGGNRIANSPSEMSPIQVERLDDVLSAVGFESPVHLVKIDVEGYELKVLMGAQQILRRWKPILFVEVDDANLGYYGNSAVGLLRFLNALGYQDVRHAQTGESLSSASSYVGRHFDLIAR